MNSQANQETDRLEKMKAHEAQMGNVATPYGAALQDLEPCRTSLRDRVYLDLARSRREVANRERLEELNHLLDKHPDVARILDLIETVRG